MLIMFTLCVYLCCLEYETNKEEEEKISVNINFYIIMSKIIQNDIKVCCHIVKILDMHYLSLHDKRIKEGRVYLY